jgi:importin-5
MACF